IGLVLVYNSNGREMPTYDSQPTKFAARELALYGRLTLDRVVAMAPDYGTRPAFQRDRHGRYRSAYSVVPSIEAAIPASILHVTRLVDLRAPLAPNLIAKLTASVLTAAAVALVFSALARTFGIQTAFLVALGLGLGTNLWPLASGTLWQLETVSIGLAIALYAWFRPRDELQVGWVVAGAMGVALAASARPQIGPMVVVLLAGLMAHVGLKRAASAVAVVAAAAAVLMAFQWWWFGDVLGATPMLQAQNLAVHGVTGTLNPRPWVGAAGLLVSPNRGLIVFSPVVLVAFIGMYLARREGPARGGRWWTWAAIVQFGAYSCYSMWWGGHTFGPRYLVDALIPLAPAAAMGVGWVAARRWRRMAALVALALSILVAGTGAYCFPHDRWNTDPDVDLNHERIWDWSDLQVVRCWRTGPSPANFSLFDWEAVRQSRP
ncbi:MAG: hypothetical protein NUW22_05440, partial [Acidobacteria bacterium]|nr:hypothetical protein [Acidobacteriota bacterium]